MATSWKKLCPSSVESLQWIDVNLSWPSAQACGVIQRLLAHIRFCESYLDAIAEEPQIHYMNTELLKCRYLCCEMQRNQVEEKVWPNVSLRRMCFDFYCHHRFSPSCFISGAISRARLSFFSFIAYPPCLIHVGNVALVLPADLSWSCCLFSYWWGGEVC